MRPIRRLPALACLLLLGLGLAGCFDYEVELGLTQPGKGYLDVRLELPAYAAQDYPVEHLHSIVFPKPERKMETVGERLALSERSSFPHLDELAVHRVWFEVKEIGTGVLGMGNYAFQVTAKMHMAEGDLPNRDVRPGTEAEARSPQAGPSDPTEIKARQLMARSLQGHYVTMSMRLPGQVVKGRSLILGSSQVDPVIAEDGAVIKWKVPLAVLVAEDVRNTLEFVCEFRGRLEFRAYMQKDVHSHYPDWFDEGLASGQELGDRVKAQPRKSSSK